MMGENKAEPFSAALRRAHLTKLPLRNARSATKSPGKDLGLPGQGVFLRGHFRPGDGSLKLSVLEEGMNRILVVNDEESTRILYSEEFLEEGYNVTTAQMGPQVTRLIKETRPDLVLLDIRSSQTDALDLLMDIRDAYHDLPVLVYADNFPLQFRMKSRAADYWVLKSLSLTDLKLRIKKILEGRVQSSSGLGHKKSREPGFGYTGMIDSFW